MNKLLDEILDECSNTPPELAEAALGIIAMMVRAHQAKQGVETYERECTAEELEELFKDACKAPTAITKL